MAKKGDNKKNTELALVEEFQVPEVSGNLREIIEESTNYQHKPVVYAFEAKYYLVVENDKEKVEELYDKAIAFAKMLNDDILVKNLKMEKEDDLACF